MPLPIEAQKRKQVPIATGLIDYFPDALAAVAEVSFIGNEQHNPGSALHWDRAKSTDEADALMRHFVERGKFDSDGVRHSAKVAWRALAMLQKELEASDGDPAGRYDDRVSPILQTDAAACYYPFGEYSRPDPHVAKRGSSRCVGCGISRADAALLGSGLRRMNIYLSGPMRGRDELNRPAFARAAAELRAAGYHVFSPGEQPDNEIRANLAVDMAWICAHADGIALLPDWLDSKGARAEAALGSAIGIHVAPVEAFLGHDVPDLN